MEDKEMLKRLNIISSMKIEDAVVEYPYKIPYFPITAEDKDVLKQLLYKYTLQTKRINETIKQLEDHVHHCELEANHSLETRMCHIALHADKNFLSILKRRR